MQAARFSRESIRAILENPFYTGWIASYLRPEFSLEDNIEHPENIPSPKIEGNSREILEFFQGQHDSLVRFEDWQAIQAIRKQRATTPTVSTESVRIYPLSGVARCWECFDEIEKEFTLRGSTGNDIRYYRCAYVHDHSLKRKKKNRSRIDGVNPVVDSIDERLTKRHGTLRADRLESQVYGLMSKLVIPKEWDDWIAAYYLSDDGMAEFERAEYGYRQELKDLRKLYLADQISQAEIERQTRLIRDKLNSLRPSLKPGVLGILGDYRPLSSIWTNLQDGEKRVVLGIIFDGLFFDRGGRLVRARAHPPFQELLDLPEDGMIKEL